MSKTLFQFNKNSKTIDDMTDEELVDYMISVGHIKPINKKDIVQKLNPNYNEYSWVRSCNSCQKITSTCENGNISYCEDCHHLFDSREECTCTHDRNNGLKKKDKRKKRKKK